MVVKNAAIEPIVVEWSISDYSPLHSLFKQS